MFITETLPAAGLLHLRILWLLGMIGRLGSYNIIKNHGIEKTQQTVWSAWPSLGTSVYKIKVHLEESLQIQGQ